MWPSKEGLGVQLSYGVNGNGIVVSNENSNSSTYKRLPRLEFPRIRNQGITLNKVGKSNIVLVNQQTSSFDLNAKVYNNLQNAVANQPLQPKRKMYSDSNIYVPEEILKSYLIESRSLTSTIAYDPTFGQMFTIFDVRSRSGLTSSKAIAFVTGETGTILNISILKYEIKELLNNRKESVDVNALIPLLTDPFQVSLSEPIKQIEHCKLKEGFDYIPLYLIIRSDSRVYVLNCFKGKSQHYNSHIELDILGELQTSDLMGFNFSDVTFNPWVSTQFGAVDVKGNFGIWNINSKKEALTKLKKFDSNPKTSSDEPDSSLKVEPTIYDVTELSNWKRITWAHDYNHIFVVSRSSLTQFELTPELSSQRLITSDTWSKIQDIHKNPESMKYAFILTSKELIWFEVSNPLRRLMSWKHFLDDKDPSLRLQVSEYEDSSKFICIIYSQIRPIILVYNFGIKDGMPFSLKDPYYIRKSTDQRGNNTGQIRQVFLTELNRQFYSSAKDDENITTDSTFPKHMVMALFELSTDLGLTLNLYNTTANLHLNKSLIKADNLDSSSSCESSTNFERDIKIRDKLSYFKKFSKADFESIAKGLKCDTNATKGDDEIKIVQDYAFRLGEGAMQLNEEWNKLNAIDDISINKDPYYLSLNDISSSLPLSISDITEFDSMIEQLSSFYGTKDINVSSKVGKSFLEGLELFADHLKSDGNLYTVNDISSIIKKAYENEALQGYNHSNILKKLSILIGASLIKAKTNGLGKYYLKKLDLAMKNATTQVQSILNDWDNENYDNNHESPTRVDNFDSQVTIPDIITSSMPTIKVASQSRSTPKSHSKVPSRTSQLRHKALTQTASAADGYKSPLSQSTEIPSNPSSSDGPSQESLRFSQEGKSSQLIPPSSRLTSQHSQKRFMSSQASGSQRKVKKKKRKGGFA